MGGDITLQNPLVGHSRSVGWKTKEKSDGEAFPVPEVYTPLQRTQGNSKEHAFEILLTLRSVVKTWCICAVPSPTNHTEVNVGYTKGLNSSHMHTKAGTYEKYPGW